MLFLYIKLNYLSVILNLSVAGFRKGKNRVGIIFINNKIMRNLDLKIIGIQELDTKEITEIEGGFWPYIIGALVGAVFTQDLDKLVEAYHVGYEAGKK